MKNNLRLINIALVVFIAISLVVKLYYYDKVSTAGSALNDLETKLSDVLAENEGLVVELNNSSSVKSIHQRALDSGYIKSNVEYLKDLNLASAR